MKIELTIEVDFQGAPKSVSAWAEDIEDLADELDHAVAKLSGMGMRAKYTCDGMIVVSALIPFKATVDVIGAQPVYVVSSDMEHSIFIGLERRGHTYRD